MKKIFLLGLLLLPFLFSFFEHPIYISNTTIDYKEDDKRLEIAIMIFSNDLQDVISASKNTRVEIGTDREHPKATEYIVEYLEKHFKLNINGKQVSYNYLSRNLDKSEDFAMWILIEVPKIRKPKSIELFNDILVDFYPSQQNIISYGEGDGKYRKFLTREGVRKVKLL